MKTQEIQPGARVRLPGGFAKQGVVTGRLEAVEKQDAYSGARVTIPLRRPAFWVQPDVAPYKRPRPILFWDDEITML